MAEENNQKQQDQNIFNLLDKEKIKNKTEQAGEKVGGVISKFIKFVAKKAGLPDPETGKPFEKDGEQKATENIQTETSTPENEKVDVNTTLEQDVENQEKQEKFNFNKIMSGVSNVMDKIEKKVEEKTGLDLDAPLKKREEKLKKETEATSNTTEATVTKPAQENEIEKNNEEYLSENH